MVSVTDSQWESVLRLLYYYYYYYSLGRLPVVPNSRKKKGVKAQDSETNLKPLQFSRCFGNRKRKEFNGAGAGDIHHGISTPSHRVLPPLLVLYQREHAPRLMALKHSAQFVLLPRGGRFKRVMLPCHWLLLRCCKIHWRISLGSSDHHHPAAATTSTNSCTRNIFYEEKVSLSAMVYLPYQKIHKITCSPLQWCFSMRASTVCIICTHRLLICATGVLLIHTTVAYFI